MTVASIGAGLTLAIVLATPLAGHALQPDEARVRVQHHLRQVERLSGHFETVLLADCPRFPSAAAWDAYMEGEMEQVLLLVAHLEQAWAEAKRTGDDDVRRTAKAPRRQRDRVRHLVDKLAGCAEMHGALFSPIALWRRVERDLPLRRMEVALPE